jgi:hypothetical protein
MRRPPFLPKSNAPPLLTDNDSDKSACECKEGLRKNMRNVLRDTHEIAHNKGNFSVANYSEYGTGP